jgi:hypothetical protein
MKKTFKTLIMLAILGTLAYYFQAPIRARLSIFSAPCEEPIAYTLGRFDARFGISKSYFKDALSEAEKIWEKPKKLQGESFEKDLFVYKENGEGGMLKINLVYDYRQEATEKLAGLGIVVENNKASYDSLRAKFTALKAEYASAKKDYDAQVNSFNAKQDVYEAQVKYWNARGGAPKGEYEKLQAEKAELDAELSELKRKQAQINEMVEEINAMVVVLNRLAGTLNLTVDKYNTINVSRGESFEEGVYYSDGFDRAIDIYEFSSRDKLVRVLAHELGHALGLPHVADPKAMMYELNVGDNKVLIETDISALKAKCGVE